MIADHQRRRVTIAVNAGTLYANAETKDIFVAVANPSKQRRLMIMRDVQLFLQPSVI